MPKPGSSQPIPAGRTVRSSRTAAPAVHGMHAGGGPAHHLTGAYGLHVVDLVKRWGVEPEDLLQGFGLTRSDLATPDQRLPLDVAVALFERARTMTGEPALGVYLGLQMQASAHGMVGFAAMSARTVRSAIRVAVQYAAIRTTALSLSPQVTDEAAALVLVEHADLQSVREIYVTSILIGFWRMGSTLAGRPLDVVIDFKFPRPAYFDRFEHALPPTRFDQPANQIVLRDLSALDAPISMADPASLRLAQDKCDEILLSMGLDGRLAPRVRALLNRQEGTAPSLKDVARALHLSTRTLRRRLEAEEVTFSSLLDGERMQRALVLLRSQELTIEDIAERLGYQNLANFTRAFRRWTGRTPSAYRQGG
jgi:AraC-like DNA-binding protein